MFGWDDAIGAGAGLIGGIAGLFGGNPRQKYYDAAMKQLQGTNTNVASRDVGDIQGTAFNRVDPTSRQAMLGALQGLQSKYAQGGLDAIDRGKMAMLQQAQATTAKQQADRVLQNQRAQGTLNSGRALAGQLLAGQEAQRNAAMQSVLQGAEAEKARMGALSGIVGTAQGIQSGDFTVANANDALSRFNKGLQVGNAERNQQAQTDSARLGIAKGSALGNIGGNAPATNPMQDFLGTAARAGQTASKLDWGSLGGGPQGVTADESAGLSMARPQGQKDQDFAWYQAPDQRNY